jgi:transcriptional regulator with XRE-family HTH domain
MNLEPGRLLREARIRHGLSQERLAIRAGTTQSAISRIEQERGSPAVRTLEELLRLMGEDLVLSMERRDTGIDVTLNRRNLEFSPEQRIERGLDFADLVRRNRGAIGRRGPQETMGHDLQKPLRPQPLLQALARHGVDFVIVGGLAGIAHGSSYPTYDLDVAYSRDSSNLVRLVDALQEIGVTLRGAPADLPSQLDAATLANGANFTFDTEFGSFDILGDAAGIKGYDELRREAVVEEVFGIEVKVASLDHLIAMKRAANRPKDQLMVLEYVELADEIRRREAEEKG